MSALVTRDSVIEFYRDMWVSLYESAVPTFLSCDYPLPPFLCRSLAFGDPPVFDKCCWNEAMTGSRDGAPHPLETTPGTRCLHWGDNSVSKDVFQVLPIDGHRIVGLSAERRHLLRKALILLRDLGSPFFDSVLNFVGLVIWLERDPGQTDIEPLTASSFPALPHCAFLTDTATKELLPNIALSHWNAAALAESLYHESLHQHLSATILQHDIFVPSYQSSSSPRISAPWRDRHWPVDRALHALYVYSNLFRMRRALLEATHLDDAERPIWERAHGQSLGVIDHLRVELDKHHQCFTSEGLDLVRDVQKLT